MGVISHMMCRSTIETEHLAAKLAGIVQIGDVIGLSGDLGAGKTTFARGFVRALTNAHDDVPSPTFTLMQAYDTAKGPLWHCDLYRLTKPDDALELGLEEAFGTSICLVEWPERMGTLLPKSRLLLTFQFEPSDANLRRIECDGGYHWAERLRRVVL
ncbi:MAG: tRNA (adenosine(37)-N6)-threonylcarbamoyltransferase complex ATPase subunit type 1 TsaE [Alphaproteobacteria bacterium]|nr:tRNA (adenosine(37)-N6)-threonylcarbamoyltransferase complex ATPase subunit type 1 TsaE [Alphaproteobacteria bacterium]PHX98763.1 MAG: tRNA (adenosine(37)-N6)-threonylcarbamoyltransferase complex ATPase subunit type 1 TsaE [Rhodospirillaceae bacterium]